MVTKKAAILGWTGRGCIDDLLSSVRYSLKDQGIRGKARRAGRTIVVDGPEPLSVAAAVGRMPGVGWVAAGFACTSVVELSAAGRVLAKAYLRKGSKFRVRAEGATPSMASDLGGGLTGSLLDSARGSRASDAQGIVFRASFDGEAGAVGAQVAEGPGGVPTGEEEVACLVSGGKHSAVLAWLALLQGFKVRLVHAASGEENLRAVASLYSELSFRADPRGLGLEVLTGASVLGAISTYAGESKVSVFAGFSRGGEDHMLPDVIAPLYLMPEESFAEEYEALGVRASMTETDWRGESKGAAARFGGKRADISGVLDGLK